MSLLKDRRHSKILGWSRLCRMERVWVFVSILSLGIAVGWLGCQEKQVPHATAKPTVAPGFTRIQQKGKELYEHYCVLCHGSGGQGDGFNAYNLKPRPQNFTDAAFMRSLSDTDVIDVIKGGGRSIGRSVLMPPWGKTLTGKQIQAIVAYLRTFAASQQPGTAPSDSE